MIGTSPVRVGESHPQRAQLELPRRLFGLNPTDVARSLSSLAQEQDRELQSLEQELAEQRSQRQALRRRLAVLEQELDIGQERMQASLAASLTEMGRNQQVLQAEAQRQDTITGRILDQIEEREVTLQRVQQAGVAMVQEIQEVVARGLVALEGTSELLIANSIPTAKVTALRRHAN